MKKIARLFPAQTQSYKHTLYTSNSPQQLSKSVYSEFSMLITVIGEQDEQIDVKPTMSENNIVTSLMHSGSTFSPVNNAAKL